MNKDFWKQPRFIASAVALLCFLVLDYMVVKASYGGFGSHSAGLSGLDIAKEFDGIDILLWLIPLINVYLIWAAFNPNNDMAKGSYANIAKIGFLIAAAFFWARYMFLMEDYPGVKQSAGIGMWITLLASIFLQFEGAIMKQVNQMTNKGGNPPSSPPPPGGNPS